MKNITINFKNNTIEISSTFAKNASNYGSEAYNALMNAKRDFPTYTVVTVKPTKKNSISFKGLDLKYMEKYITNKSGADSEQMKTFKTLCGNTDDELAARVSFGEIKVWFLNEHPEIEDARKNVEEIIAKAKKAREDKKNANKAA